MEQDSINRYNIFSKLVRSRKLFRDLVDEAQETLPGTKRDEVNKQISKSLKDIHESKIEARKQFGSN